MSTSRTADKFVIRLPDGMRDRIAELAKENHRSMNAEIISRLEGSIQNPAPTKSSGPTQLSEHTLEILNEISGALTSLNGGYHVQGELAETAWKFHNFVLAIEEGQRK